MPGLDEDLAAALEDRAAADLYRRRRVVERLGGARVRVDGRELLDFCANDYLGLATDPRLVAAAREALDGGVLGSGAAHLITGHSPEHHALEEELAEWTGRERALLFSTGYMANIGLCQALVGRGDTVLQDRLNHASLIDGAYASGARPARFAHADAGALAGRLERARGRRLVLSDSVFSMDGDIAPLSDLARVCAEGEAWLVADEAHALGTLGPEGAGAVAAAGLAQTQVPVLMGTLGKALGTFGAFVAGSETLIETLIQQARTYVYTTAPPPAMAAAARRAVSIVRTESVHREKLAERIACFREQADAAGLPRMESPTPIQPVPVGDSGRALAISRTLAEQGWLVQAIRPPTVPEGTARLRVSLSAAHEDEQVRALVEALARALEMHSDTSMDSQG